MRARLLLALAALGVLAAVPLAAAQGGETGTIVVQPASWVWPDAETMLWALAPEGGSPGPVSAGAARDVAPGRYDMYGQSDLGQPFLIEEGIEVRAGETTFVPIDTGIELVGDEETSSLAWEIRTLDGGALPGRGIPSKPFVARPGTFTFHVWPSSANLGQPMLWTTIELDDHELVRVDLRSGVRFAVPEALRATSFTWGATDRTSGQSAQCGGVGVPAFTCAATLPLPPGSYSITLQAWNGTHVGASDALVVTVAPGPRAEIALAAIDARNTALLSWAATPAGSGPPSGTGHTRAVILVQEGVYDVYAFNATGVPTLAHAGVAAREGEVTQLGLQASARRPTSGNAVVPIVLATTGVVAVGGVGVGLGIAFAKLQSFRWRWLALLAPLYTRLARQQILEHGTREAIYGHIEANPGVHLRELQRALDLKHGTMLHHLGMLRRQGFVKVVRDGPHLRHYLTGTALRVEGRDPLRDEVVDHIAANPGVTNAAVAAALGKRPSLTHYHVERLAEEGVIVKERAGREVRLRAVAQAPPPPPSMAPPPPPLRGPPGPPPRRT